jgi:1-pyrroline-5-carboxylate dehydrogenase
VGGHIAARRRLDTVRPDRCRFGTDDRAIVEADQALRYTAGNLTINDKPTGAVVGQQPFGGARASGTNDKIGTVWSSIRFLSPRSVKRREG